MSVMLNSVLIEGTVEECEVGTKQVLANDDDGYYFFISQEQNGKKRIPNEDDCLLISIRVCGKLKETTETKAKVGDKIRVIGRIIQHSIRNFLVTSVLAEHIEFPYSN